MARNFLYTGQMTPSKASIVIPPKWKRPKYILSPFSSGRARFACPTLPLGRLCLAKGLSKSPKGLTKRALATRYSGRGWAKPCPCRFRYLRSLANSILSAKLTAPLTLPIRTPAKFIIPKMTYVINSQRGKVDSFPLQEGKNPFIKDPYFKVVGGLGTKGIERIGEIIKVKSPYNKKGYFTSYSKLTEVQLITIGLASPKRIQQWAEKTLPNGKIIGQVLNANTLHHKTFKPQKGGLFCERIFGPLKDFICSCNKTAASTLSKFLTKPNLLKLLITKDKGDKLLKTLPGNNSPKEPLVAGPKDAQQKPIITTSYSHRGEKRLTPDGLSFARKEDKIKDLNRFFCPKCDVEYTWSVIRRYQLGYIQLISPVTHVWYLKGSPSYISILLDMKKRQLEYVNYCSETMTLEYSLKENDFWSQSLKGYSKLFGQTPQELLSSWKTLFDAQSPFFEKKISLKKNISKKKNRSKGVLFASQGTGTVREGNEVKRTSSLKTKSFSVKVDNKRLLLGNRLYLEARQGHAPDSQDLWQPAPTVRATGKALPKVGLDTFFLRRKVPNFFVKQKNKGLNNQQQKILALKKSRNALINFNKKGRNFFYKSSHNRVTAAREIGRSRYRRFLTDRRPHLRCGFTTLSPRTASYFCIDKIKKIRLIQKFNLDLCPAQQGNIYFNNNLYKRIPTSFYILMHFFTYPHKLKNSIKNRIKFLRVKPNDSLNSNIATRDLNKVVRVSSSCATQPNPHPPDRRRPLRVFADLGYPTGYPSVANPPLSRVASSGTRHSPRWTGQYKVKQVGLRLRRNPTVKTNIGSKGPRGTANILSGQAPLFYYVKKQRPNYYSPNLATPWGCKESIPIPKYFERGSLDQKVSATHLSSTKARHEPSTKLLRSPIRTQVAIANRTTNYFHTGLIVPITLFFSILPKISRYPLLYSLSPDYGLKFFASLKNRVASSEVTLQDDKRLVQRVWVSNKEARRVLRATINEEVCAVHNKIYRAAKLNMFIYVPYFKIKANLAFYYKKNYKKFFIKLITLQLIKIKEKINFYIAKKKTYMKLFCYEVAKRIPRDMQGSSACSPFPFHPEGSFKGARLSCKYIEFDYGPRGTANILSGQAPMDETIFFGPFGHEGRVELGKAFSDRTYSNLASRDLNLSNGQMSPLKKCNNKVKKSFLLFYIKKYKIFSSFKRNFKKGCNSAALYIGGPSRLLDIGFPLLPSRTNEVKAIVRHPKGSISLDMIATDEATLPVELGIKSWFYKHINNIYLSNKKQAFIQIIGVERRQTLSKVIKKTKYKVRAAVQTLCTTRSLKGSPRDHLGATKVFTKKQRPKLKTYFEAMTALCGLSRTLKYSRGGSQVATRFIVSKARRDQQKYSASRQKKVANNIYCLSHRQTWELEKDWLFFQNFSSALPDLRVDIPIPIYTRRFSFTTTLHNKSKKKFAGLIKSPVLYKNNALPLSSLVAKQVGMVGSQIPYKPLPLGLAKPCSGRTFISLGQRGLGRARFACQPYFGRGLAKALPNPASRGKALLQLDNTTDNHAPFFSEAKKQRPRRVGCAYGAYLSVGLGRIGLQSKHISSSPNQPYSNLAQRDLNLGKAPPALPNSKIINLTTDLAKEKNPLLDTTIALGENLLAINNRANASYSGAGLIQHLLKEFDFWELKKIHKQNRILLYQLNYQIFRLRKYANLNGINDVSFFVSSKKAGITKSLAPDEPASGQRLKVLNKKSKASLRSSGRDHNLPYPLGKVASYGSRQMGLPFGYPFAPPRYPLPTTAKVRKTSVKQQLKKLYLIRDNFIRRAKLVRTFLNINFLRTDSAPESMILNILPVLPPDLRPIVKIGGQIAASDLNRLYQRVMYRNERLKKFLKDPATSQSYEMKYAQRLLQEAVDNLIQNGKAGSIPERDSRGRTLKSLSEILKGKQGRFRQYLLGKRVDYSGRSVIVVGPKLKLHQCGIPKEMALELFLPFLLKRILHENLARTVAGAKNLIKTDKNLVWELLREIMQVTPVLLNRAPTLHRLGIQAFQPKLVDGRAILLHPLSCPAFNADFDGDQMAVHVPITVEARAEAWKLMLARNNLLSPATGEPIVLPSQDMVLGCYYVTVLNRAYNQVYSSGRKTGLLRLPGSAPPLNKSPYKNKDIYPASSPRRGSKVVNIDSYFKSERGNQLRLKNNINIDSQPCMEVEVGTVLFNSIEDVIIAYEKQKINLQQPIWVKWKRLVENSNSIGDYNKANKKTLDGYPMEIQVNLSGNWNKIYLHNISRFSGFWNSSPKEIQDSKYSNIIKFAAKEQVRGPSRTYSLSSNPSELSNNMEFIRNNSSVLKKDSIEKRVFSKNKGEEKLNNLYTINFIQNYISTTAGRILFNLIVMKIVERSPI